MTIIKIVTDNEWKGKYELLEQKYLEDNFPIWSLGDNLQTGEVGQVGKDSFFKTKRKQITANNLEFKNLNLYEQMKGVYKIFPEEFVQNYGLCVNVLKQGVEFLKNSSLPTMTAITGNRESDYQMLLDLFEKEITGEKLDYMNLLLETGKFEMIFQPETRQIEGTSILLIPYDKEMDQTQHDYESNIERLYEAVYRRRKFQY